ncbi:MAB_1171c family putative transporter [Solwaraspora sp. WMMB762]|uniref:MAB_1171c family putative transporter n=1 Tax=Solwaraspora sp. WMMB762 TaxID=3404120 RepID=UPI003B93D144
MDIPLYAVCAAAGWLAFGYKLGDLRRDRDNRVLRAMVYAFCSFAAGVTVAVRPVAEAVDRITGLPNLAKLLAHAGVMGVAANSEILLLFLALPPAVAARRVRRRVIASMTAFGLLTVLWATTLAGAAPIRLVVEDAAHPAVAGYLVVYLIVFVCYAADLARLCWRFSLVTPRRWLRRGLRITAFGATAALLYCATKAGYLVAYRVGREPAGEPQIAAVLVTVGALSMLIGLTLPTWGPAMDTGRTWLRRHRSWRRLAPLWRAVSAAQPHLVLDDRAHHRRVALRDIDYALHRRITEIRDSRLALRPYIDRRIAPTADRLAAAAGLTGPDRTALVEAAMIAAGVRQAATGTPVREPDFSEPHDPPNGYPGEIAWLSRVTEWFSRSPLVDQVLAAAASSPEPRPAPPPPHRS